MFLRLILPGAILALLGLGTIAAPTAAAPAPSALASREQSITLEEALARTLRDNPDLTSATEEMHGSEAELRQAGRLPNPELTVTLENVAGSGVYQDTDSAEFTIELSQPLELGGKRRLRREAASLGYDLAASERARARTDALATTRQRYVAVLAAQQAMQLAKEQAEVAEKSLAAAEARIDAGQVPRIDRLRLQGEVSTARLAVTQTERAMEAACRTLAASWGSATADFSRAAGDLATLPELPELSVLEQALEQAPATASRRLATGLFANDLAQARARQIPDPSVTVGWRQFREDDENALLFGVTFPLPVFDQRQAEVTAASRRLNGAQAREHGARIEVHTSLRSAWQALAGARAEADVLAGQVVPNAAEAFAATDFGYQAGKFGLIELLDAQRAWFEVRQRQLEAQTAAHLAAIEMQRLLGREPATDTNQLSSL